MKTKSEYLDAYRHELAGIVMDSLAYTRSGADCAAFVRNAMKKIDAILVEQYDDFVPPKSEPKTETPAPPMKTLNGQPIVTGKPERIGPSRA